jgi:predicted nucleotide-binding protein
MSKKLRSQSSDKSKPVAKEDSSSKRAYLSQSDVPSYSLEEALKIASALVDNYAGGPTKPLLVAKAMNLQPTSPNFRQRCGASIAYGLTDGGYNAGQITLLPLGKRILTPTVEGDDLIAKREAFLKPKIIGLFLTKYDNSKLPRRDIALNVLAEMGVPKESSAKTYDLIVDGARSLGLLTEINGVPYIALQPVGQTLRPETPASAVVGEDGQDRSGLANDQTTDTPGSSASDHSVAATRTASSPGASRAEYRRKRVFITHGKDKGFVEPIKKLLGFGQLEPVVSVERQTVSLSVPDKVMNDMRSCGAAIIHVDAEQQLIDAEAKSHTVLNPNVLIEIGAAMALYGKRFILLVREGVRLPSNLQGLYEVRYVGDIPDANVTIKLLEAINDIKNHTLPE